MGFKVLRRIDGREFLARGRLHKFIVDEEADWQVNRESVRSGKVLKHFRHRAKSDMNKGQAKSPSS